MSESLAWRYGKKQPQVRFSDQNFYYITKHSKTSLLKRTMISDSSGFSALNRLSWVVLLTTSCIGLAAELSKSPKKLTQCPVPQCSLCGLFKWPVWTSSHSGGLREVSLLAQWLPVPLKPGFRSHRTSLLPLLVIESPDSRDERTDGSCLSRPSAT